PRQCLLEVKAMQFNLLKPKQILAIGLFSSVMFLSPLSSLALTVQEIPNPRQRGVWVTDIAGILNNETESQINQLISQLEAKNGTEMAVVTVPKTSPADSPKAFATELFNYWGVGKKGKDNGVLFLISVGDRRVEIETGYGVEPILPDAQVGNIINSQIIPRFKKKDFAGGTLAGTKALVVILESERSPTVGVSPSPLTSNPQTSQPENNSNPWVFVTVVGASVLGISGAAAYLRRKNKIFIPPSGRTRKKQGNYIFCCADCQKPMLKVDAATVEEHLNKAEKTAQKLGSVSFEDWKCPHCSEKLTDTDFNIVALESRSSRFKRCPHCEELTVTRTETTVVSPTQHNVGRRLITDKCHSCAYHNKMEEIIPRLPPPPPPSSGGWGGGGGGDFGGGGGSFDGGSSGGGGAGGSW
ncbi:TPM domain-containing protein, partial [Nostoc sp. NIES-2111]